MKVIPFPKPGDEHDERAFAAQLDAALRGEAGGEAADYWRELRADVRSLAPPISPEFERELRERVEARAAAPSRGRRRPSMRGVIALMQAWLGSGMRARLVAVGGICAMVAVVALAIASPWRAFQSSSSSSAKAGRVDNLGPSGGPVKALEQSQVQTYQSKGASAGASAAGVQALVPASARPADKAESTAESSLTPAAGASSARVQQRAASITLAPKPAEVQLVADQIAQLAARDGGFVQNSQVRLQRGTGGEATLQLSLPSARLSAALAELARLAPTRAQSQSLQDITDEYGAARTKLADAVAARQALLRALSKASTQGQIESLRARLSLAGGAIAQARTAFQSVAKRGSNSAVEVTVLGDAHASAGESTLSKALNDAGDVLKVALAVLIVALAVLVPLALLAAIVAIAWRVSRRRLRERALS
jgi:hypothetical protein